MDCLRLARVIDSVIGMNLRVQREDGSIETIELSGNVRIEEGEAIDCVVAGDREHFFTKAGFYDGWGMPMSPGTTLGEAREIIEAVERRRRITDE